MSVCESQGTALACSELYILVVFAVRVVIEKANNYISFIHFPVSFLTLQRQMISFFLEEYRLSWDES